MQKDYIFFLECIKAVIWNEDFPIDCVDDVDWEKFFYLSTIHQVQALTYCKIHATGIIEKIAPQIATQWRKESFHRTISDKMEMSRGIQILAALQSENIMFVGIKGLVIRKLYKQAEHRTMGDIDILVKADQFEMAKKIILENGYSAQEKTDSHQKFCKKEELSIEVHWKLLGGNSFRGSNVLEENLWANIIPIEEYGLTMYKLNREDEVLFQFAHMLKHMWGSGFGIRQICDIAIMLYVYQKELDWDYIKQMARKLKVEHFISLILLLCKKYFDLDFLAFWESDNKIKMQQIEELMIYILENGVHGMKGSVVQQAAITVIKSRGGNRSEQMRWLLPTQKQLTATYQYAKKNKLLLPIAWIHRLIRSICRFIREENGINMKQIIIAYRRKARIIKITGAEGSQKII